MFRFRSTRSISRNRPSKLRELSAAYPEINFYCADLFEWNLSPGLKLDGLKPSSFPYDIVLCSLALHHFSNDDAVRVLQKIRELSTSAF